MSFKVEILADSANGLGKRITTMLVTFPRIILAEFNTHRMFSRNSASSRAIPFQKMLRSVEDNPFIPIAWQKDHKGMQGSEYSEGNDLELAIDDWNQAKDAAVLYADWLSHRSGGVTKQLCNRLLEPFMWHTVIVTATEWENFFALRCPKYDVLYDGKPTYYRSKKDLLNSIKQFPNVHDAVSQRTELEWLQGNKGQAEIHMMKIAEMMWDAYNESIPQTLESGMWHIPYKNEIHKLYCKDEEIESRELVKVATVMAARTSYTVVGEDQKPLTYKRMLEIHDEMVAADPKHMSPFEHCAKAAGYEDYDGADLLDGREVSLESNFKGGWVQYRKMIQGENITK